MITRKRKFGALKRVPQNKKELVGAHEKKKLEVYLSNLSRPCFPTSLSLNKRRASYAHISSRCCVELSPDPESRLYRKRPWIQFVKSRGVKR